MGEWAREQLQPWLARRLEFPTGPLFRVIHSPTRGRPCSVAAVRADLRLELALDDYEGTPSWGRLDRTRVAQ